MSDSNANVEAEAEATPDFTALFGPAFAPVVQMAWEQHVAYTKAHAATYGSSSGSSSFKAWKASLPDFEPEANYAGTGSLSESCRLSENPSELLWLIEQLSDMLSDAKSNLASLHKGVKPTSSPTDVDVPSLRVKLDDMITAGTKLASAGLLDEDRFWSVFPHRTATYKGGTTRTVYDGPSIPKTRTSHPVRANARLNVQVLLSDGTWHEGQGDFGSQIKTMLKLTIPDLRELTDDFSSEDYLSKEFTIEVDDDSVPPKPRKLTFRIVKRAADA